LGRRRETCFARQASVTPQVAAALYRDMGEVRAYENKTRCKIAATCSPLASRPRISYLYSRTSQLYSRNSF
ncbi:hypothetical protein, partial [uncultured Pseudoalteromonas sp.]|uniref:hypothetical protein n=1 Tax=uncultured Pseudoalteromonas sp. TaxID=114053 RepID=UPI002630AF6E